MSFPSFEIGTHFESGMSGGLVINSTSEVCGIVCSSFQGESGLGPAYACLIWPVMLIPVHFEKYWSVATGLSGEHLFYEIALKTFWRPRGIERLSIEGKTAAFKYGN